MKPIKRKAVVFIVLLLIAGLFLTFQISVINRSKALPNGILVSSENGISITFNDCDSDKMAVVSSGLATKKSTVTSEFSTIGYPIQARLFYTNQSYCEIIPFDFLYGGYFVQNPIDEANRYVVISDILSLKLFKEYDTVGRKLTVGQQQYTICGIFKQKTDFISRISSDGLEQIYLSHSNLQDNKAMLLTQLYIKGEKGQLDKSLIAKAQLPQNPPLYYDCVTNFIDLKQLTLQAVLIAIFLLGMNIIGFLAYLFLEKAKTVYLSIKYDKPKSIILKQGIAALIFIIAIAAVFLTVKFDLFIPTNMLPPDNIFDISFYMSNIANAIQAHNATQLFSFLWNYGMALVTASYAAAALLSVATIVLWWYGVRAFRLYLPKGEW